MKTTRSTKENEPNEYMEYCNRKRKINEERLKELGLSEGFKLMKGRNNKKRANQKKVMTTTTTTQVVTRRNSRRSTRGEGGRKKPELYGSEYIDEKLLLEKKLKRRKEQRQQSENITVVKKRRVSLANAMTTEECKKFKDVSTEEFLNDMEQYYAEIIGNSATNVSRVMSQVQKLVYGKGIVHPATDNVFRKGTKILLDTNFRDLLDEASEWVYDNGGDRGNGWLVEHPVKKCFVYQHARDENKKAFFFDTKP